MDSLMLVILTKENLKGNFKTLFERTIFLARRGVHCSVVTSKIIISHMAKWFHCFGIICFILSIKHIIRCNIEMTCQC